MRPFRPTSTADQLAQYLREEISSGRLVGEMPGIKQLVKTLGVNSVTTTKAVRKLEREGLIIARGDRRKRLIAKQALSRNQSMRVGILYYDAHDIMRADCLQLRQSLIDSGHTPVIPAKTMEDLGMDAKRIISQVRSVEVDAWIIYAGSSELLQWFADGDIPAFAIYGRMNSINMASMGVLKSLVNEHLVKKLVSTGHKRIVLIVREERRKPKPGLPERQFLEQLEASGIQTGPYNIPDWVETPEGLAKCLDKLFAHTPPTALLIGDPVTFHAVQTHLSRKGINAPEQVSLYCNDYNECFDWCRPSIAHLKWDYRPTIRRVIKWISHISQGVEDTKKSFTKAVYVDGDTVGPAPPSAKVN